MGHSLVCCEGISTSGTTSGTTHCMSGASRWCVDSGCFEKQVEARLLQIVDLLSVHDLATTAQAM